MLFTKINFTLSLNATHQILYRYFFYLWDGSCRGGVPSGERECGNCTKLCSSRDASHSRQTTFYFIFILFLHSVPRRRRAVQAWAGSEGAAMAGGQLETETEMSAGHSCLDECRETGGGGNISLVVSCLSIEIVSVLIKQPPAASSATGG